MASLAGLDDINWRDLRHSFGPASEIPAWLHAMMGTDLEASRNACQELSCAIEHQGSLYDSTMAALPFLFEIAQQRGLPVRAELLALLASIGGGSDTELGEAFDRLRGPKETSRKWQAYLAMRRRAREARALVAAQSSLFLEALDEPDPSVRQAAVWALHVCEPQAHLVVQALQRRFEVEPDAPTKEILRDGLEHFAALAEQGRLPAAVSARSIRQWLQDRPAERRAQKNPFLLQTSLRRPPAPGASLCLR